MYNPYIEFTSDLTDVGIVFSFEILFDSSSLVIKHINNYHTVVGRFAYLIRRDQLTYRLYIMASFIYFIIYVYIANGG